MMQGRTLQPSLFSWVVQQHLAPEHPLLVLSGKIDWKGIDLGLGSVLCPLRYRPSSQTDPAADRPHVTFSPVRPVG